MDPTFEDYGYTVTDVQSLTTAYLHPTILLIFCHGIHTCASSAALYYIAQSAQPKRKQITLASIIAFLWSANTIIVGLHWKYVHDLFIGHGVSLEDEFDFYLHSELSISLAVGVFRVLNTLLADVILIWRCWVLYSGNLIVVAIPSLCFVAETISACFIMALTYGGRTFVGLSQANWMLVYYAMTVVTNSLCTFLILFRLVRVSGLGASFKTYRGLVEILVESAAMYAVIYVALLIVFAYEFYAPNIVFMTVYAYPQMISYSITGIAPTLIIARVMAGHSRPDDSWTRSSLPHLRTPMRSITESLRFASAPDHSTGTQRTTADDGVEQAPQLDVERDGEAEAPVSASHDKPAEVKV